MTGGAAATGNYSGERFTVRYGLAGDARSSERLALEISLEQTLELPVELVPEGELKDHVAGRIERFKEAGAGQHEVDISYAVESVGTELAQLLNVAFGNSSLNPAVTMQRLFLPDSILRGYRGPRHGQSGLRSLADVMGRPLLMTSLKPMGLASGMIADAAYEYASAGVDIVKDDHNITDQAIAPFHDRVGRCVEAVARANRESGRKSLYLANVTGPPSAALQRARLAQAEGADGLLVCPGLTGLDLVRELAEDDAIALPIVSHPSFTGGFRSAGTGGISHYAYYGQLQRLAGIDASIYVNFGGRFPVSQADCIDAALGCTEPIGDLRPAFPVPGGGMSLDNVETMRDAYGQDVIYLMGAGLRRGKAKVRETVAAVLKKLSTS